MIAVISDIRGNYEALKQVLRVIDNMSVEQIYCLGDVVGYYTQINECCEELRKRKVRCVMGNHDWYMVSGSNCPRSRSVNDCLAYQRRIITQENKKWLSTFPVILKEYGVTMVHGGWNNPIDEYLEPQEQYFRPLEGRMFVSGHTHVQKIEKYGDIIYCNPGSVGQPRDGDNRAAFAVYDGEEFQLYRVPYNIGKIGELMEMEGFSGYYYGCLNDASRNLHI